MCKEQGAIGLLVNAMRSLAFPPLGARSSQALANGNSVESAEGVGLNGAGEFGHNLM